MRRIVVPKCSLNLNSPSLTAYFLFLLFYEIKIKMDGNLRYITKRRIGSENKCASLKSGEGIKFYLKLFLYVNKIFRIFSETTPVKRLKACDIHTGTPVVPSIQSRIKALAKRNHTPESPKVEKYAAKVDNKINNEKVQLFETPNKMITCEQSNKKVENLKYFQVFFPSIFNPMNIIFNRKKTMKNYLKILLKKILRHLFIKAS